MNLKTCREAAKEFSGRASEITRTLCFSGIAVIWVFRMQSSGGVDLPHGLYAPGFFLVLALALDLFQYVSGAIVWGGFARLKELRGTSEETDFKVPRWLNWASNSAFLGKVASVAVAYALLLRYLGARFA